MRLVALLATVALLIGCVSGGPPKRIFPPEARLQELRLDGDTAVLQLRVESFSTVPSVLDDVALRLSLASGAPLDLEARPGKALLPRTADVVELRVALNDADRAAIGEALAQRRALRYRLDGTLTVTPAGRDYPVDYSSALSPVPGLDGVLR